MAGHPALATLRTTPSILALSNISTARVVTAPFPGRWYAHCRALSINQWLERPKQLVSLCSGPSLEY
jgi:hypothetical protein